MIIAIVIRTNLTRLGTYLMVRIVSYENMVLREEGTINAMIVEC